MDLDLLTKGTQNTSTTIFSVSHDGDLTAARPVLATFPPNTTDLTTIISPQHESTLLSVAHITLPRKHNTADDYKDIKNNVLNQEQCGSCYSYSTTSTLTDMFVKQGINYLYLLAL